MVFPNQNYQWKLHHINVISHMYGYVQDFNEQGILRKGTGQKFYAVFWSQ